MIVLEGIILKDDARYQYAEDYLKRKNYIFHEPIVSPENLDFIIFPFKENIESSLYDSGYFKKLRPDIQIFSGIRNNYITEQCKANNLNYYVMMEDSGVTVKNAVPTSEGVISYLITNRKNPIFNSRILVVGYGVCGRDLAKRLKALDANVYTLVRNREKEACAFSDFVTPIYLNELMEQSFDVIINTVPCQIITDEMLRRFGGTLMVDIASKPFGFDIECAKRLNEKSAVLPGIPGKYAVCYAGEILGEYIYSKRGSPC